MFFNEKYLSDVLFIEDNNSLKRTVYCIFDEDPISRKKLILDWKQEIELYVTLCAF